MSTRTIRVYAANGGPNMERFKSRIEIRSFIEQNGKLIAVEECSERLSNPKYVNGALRIVINDKVFLDESVQDLIDQLWEYFLNLIEEIDEKGSGTFSFPDQSLRISATLDNHRQMLSLHLGEPFDRRQLVTWPELRETMCTRATEFFRSLYVLDSRVMTPVIRRIEALRLQSDRNL